METETELLSKLLEKVFNGTDLPVRFLDRNHRLVAKKFVIRKDKNQYSIVSPKVYGKGLEQQTLL